MKINSIEEIKDGYEVSVILNINNQETLLFFETSCDESIYRYKQGDDLFLRAEAEGHLTDKIIDCPYCDGKGSIYIDKSSSCNKYPYSECCGSCGEDEQCKMCDNGAYKINF